MSDKEIEILIQSINKSQVVAESKLSFEDFKDYCDSAFTLFTYLETFKNKT